MRRRKSIRWATVWLPGMRHVFYGRFVSGFAVATFWTPGVPRHVGMVSQINGVLHFIHADSSPTVRKVVEHRLSDDWRARIVAVWRPA